MTGALYLQYLIYLCDDARKHCKFLVNNMWNISTYQWLQDIRYSTDSYHDLSEIFSVTYLPVFCARPTQIMRLKSMENVKLTCESYPDCLVVPPVEKSSIANSAYYAKLLIQELVTQKRLSATLSPEELEAAVSLSSSTNTNNDAEAENSSSWTVVEENDLYNLSTCLQIVDDSFEDILSSSSDGTTPQPLDCDDEQVIFENKDISQSRIYQNIFELRKEQLLSTISKTKRQCHRIPEVLYENIWDFASTDEKSLEIKHGNFCRVSTLFEETCQELVVPEVLPLRCDLDYIIPECVSQWMKELRYEYSDEDDEREKTMANQQQQVHSNNQGSPSNANQKNLHFNEIVPKSPLQKLFGDIPNEDNQNAPKTSSNNRKSIKNILQKFLSRRPSQQDLVTKGIIQYQRIYGNSLKNLCRNIPISFPKVPEFVSVLMTMIEEDHNVVSHGIYRASGNIATIHKIRVKVNEGKDLDILKEFRKETDVLTGSLKLFFRELTEPLISTEMFNELCELKDKELTDHDRLYADVENIIKRQPEYHRDVLIALIKHILYVNSFGEKNSMSIDSMSIVWGPSLIFTDNEDSGMLLQRMTNNNSIIKFLLTVYNQSYSPTKHKPPRLYSSDSTLSLASTSDKGTISRPSLKQQHSIDESYSIDDLEILIKSIQDSELAKKHNVYLMYNKGKKTKKIIDRIKAKKSIEKYTTTRDGLCSIVDTLKNLVERALVVPDEFLKDYDGGTIQSKDIESALEQLPSMNQRILELILNHLNDMRRINKEKYALELLLQSWTKVLFATDNPIAGKYLEQLLEYYQRSQEFKIAQSTRRRDILNDLNESLQLRSTRLSESETSLDGEVLKRNSSNLSDVEIRKSVKVHKDEEEQRRSNRKS